MVGPQAAIFLDPPAELGEGGQHHPIVQPVSLQVELERSNGRREFSQERLVSSHLLRMRIEPAEGYEEDLHAQLSGDDLGHKLEVVPKSRSRILGSRLIG